MIVSDGDIRNARLKGSIVIDPFDEKHLQPASYDIHMGSSLKFIDSKVTRAIDNRMKADAVMYETVELADLRGRRDVRPQDYIDACSSYYGVPVDQITSSSKRRVYYQARVMAMYLLCLETNLTLRDIGEMLGGRSHSTVLRAFESVARDIANDEEVEQQARTIRESIKEPIAGDFLLRPGVLVLVASREVIGVNNEFSAEVHGVSSNGRMGLTVHSGSPWIDPGFHGQLTLELGATSDVPVVIYPGMRIGQVVFHELTSAARVPYGDERRSSRYQGQIGPTPMR